MYRYLIIAVTAGICGGFIARSKGYSQLLWSLLCLVIPLLVVVILVMPARVLEGEIKKCPRCGTVAREKESHCSNCGKPL